MEIRQVNINGWQCNFSSDRRIMTPGQVAHGLELLAQWPQYFPHEETWVRQHHGVPSLIVRFDCVPTGDDSFAVYEVEDRPQGIGFNCKLNEDFFGRLSALRATWPQFTVVMSPRRVDKGDDYLWCEVVDLGKANGGLVLLRSAGPEESDFHRFIPQSVSTMAAEGDKSYGLPMGLWKEARWADYRPEERGDDDRIDELPWQAGFTLKPLQGTRCDDIFIVPHVGHRCRSKKASKSQVRDALRRRGRMYIQPFHAPIQWVHDGRQYFEIWRVYYGFNPQTREWVPLGGFWIARPETVKIHGASDAISGAVVLAK